MAETSGGDTGRVFVVVNPVAGTCIPEEVRRVLITSFSRRNWSYEFYETTGDDHVPSVVREALEQGFNIIIAVGGDGTVASVASALVHTGVPLGIVPVGTVNALAQELGIPLDVDQASDMLTGDIAITVIDAMEVEGLYYFFHIGIGLDAVVIRDTSSEYKRRFGSLAFLTKAFSRLSRFEPQHFTIETDGRYTYPQALQVVIANGGVMGVPQLRWGPNIRPNDKRVDVCMVMAQKPLDYADLAWHIVRNHHKRSRHMRYLSARKIVRVDSLEPVPVQADGEFIGQTPVEVRVVPGAIRVIVPRKA